MTLEEMINEQQMLVNNARTQGRAMSEEETRRFNELQQQIDTQRTQSNNAAHAREGETQTQTGNGDGGDEGDGETIEETVHREVMEEVGLKVKNLRDRKSVV